MISEIEDHILKKYHILHYIGKGGCGTVCKAIHKKTHSEVAIKKIYNAFYSQTDAQRTYREIMYLKELHGHENIVQLRKVMMSKNEKDIYLVFEYMETNLHIIIGKGTLEEIHKQYIIYQILKCLKYMHSGELVHRDLKPSNLLINAECHVKLCDFGLTRSLKSTIKDSNPIVTDYLATRWYRAPEILLGSNQYKKAVDMWSLGCILGEILIGKPGPIFPGNSTLNQLNKIFELTGIPTKEDIESIQSPFANSIMEHFPQIKPKPLETLFASASITALDLLKNLLEFNPHKRYTVWQALEHPYVAEFHDPLDEPTREKEICIELDDNNKYSIQCYQKELYLHLKSKKKTEKEKEYFIKKEVSKQFILNF